LEPQFFLYLIASYKSAQGSGGAIIPGGVQKTSGYGTSGHGLAGMVVLS